MSLTPAPASDVSTRAWPGGGSVSAVVTLARDHKGNLFDDYIGECLHDSEAVTRKILIFALKNKRAISTKKAILRVYISSAVF